MHKAIDEILKRITSDEEKKKSLDSFEEDLKMAKGILSGDFQHCPKCNDYYLKRSFITERKRTEGQVCTYKDPINSGGNEYAAGYIITIYRTCPKGHTTIIDVEEERKR